MKILMVDDSSYAMKYWVQALRRSMRVEVRSDVKKALELFASEAPWDGAVIDLMFDSGQELYKDRDPSGQRTGLLLTDDLRKIQGDLKVILLTNRANSQELREAALRPYTKVVRKMEADPIQFTDTVVSFFGGSAP